MLKNSFPNVEAGVPPSGITYRGENNRTVIADGIADSLGRAKSGSRLDAGSAPPGRTARPHRRSPIRCKRRVQELSPRFQIVDPAYQKAPFRGCRLPHAEQPAAIMEKHVPTPFYLSCTLHQNPTHSVPHIVTAADAGEAGWIPTFSCVMRFEVDTSLIQKEYHSRVESCVIPLIFTLHQVPPPNFSHPFPPPRMVDLTILFPLLEDLSVTSISVKESPVTKTRMNSQPPSSHGTSQFSPSPWIFFSRKGWIPSLLGCCL